MWKMHYDKSGVKYTIRWKWYYRCNKMETMGDAVRWKQHKKHNKAKHVCGLFLWFNAERWENKYISLNTKKKIFLETVCIIIKLMSLSMVINIDKDCFVLDFRCKVNVAVKVPFYKFHLKLLLHIWVFNNFGALQMPVVCVEMIGIAFKITVALLGWKPQYC